MKNTFYISCPIDTFSGYGARSRDFVKALIELDKYDVKIIPQRWGNCSFGFIETNPEWSFLKNYILNAPDGQLPEKPNIWCQITIPSEFQPIGDFNIGVTAGIETTICHGSWIEGMNRMNLNLVSSNHSLNVFQQSKFSKKDNEGKDVGEISLTSPTKVLFEGVDLDIFKPIKESELKCKDILDEINSIPEDYIFLSIGHWMQGDIGQDRKNLGLTIKSFYETFKNKNKKPALLLKTCVVNSSYMDRREIMRRLDIIKSQCEGDLPNIYVLTGDFTDNEMGEIYNHPKIKAMVSLTKGEGFGRPLLEFSLCNKPIMASGWSGHIDFLNKDFVGLIGGNLTPIHRSAQQKDMLIEGSHWFSPDHNNIGFFWNNVYTNLKEWDVRAKRQGFYSRTNFSFDKMKNLLSEILDTNVKEIPINVGLKLPTLKKLDKKENSLKLPLLKKIEI
jgi:hypothetical protein